MRRVVAFAAVAALFSCVSDRSPTAPEGLTDCALPLDRLARGDALVLIHQQRFIPDTVRVSAGQGVTWVNCEAPGGDPHTSTSLGGLWESPLLQTGDFYSFQYAAAGTFAYTCVPHPHMRGTVIVQ